jgi:hypothetical protein
MKFQYGMFSTKAKIMLGRIELPVLWERRNLKPPRVQVEALKTL